MQVNQHKMNKMMVATNRRVVSFSENELNHGKLTSRSVISTMVPISDPQRVIKVLSNINQ